MFKVCCTLETGPYCLFKKASFVFAFYPTPSEMRLVFFVGPILSQQMLSTVPLSQSILSLSHLEGGTGDMKLVCDRPFAPLLRICSSPRAPSPICALLSKTVQCQYVGGLVWSKKI